MSELKPVFVGKDWFPWVAGGLNRYFYGEVHSFGDSAPKIVSFVRESSPSPLRPMASEQSSLRERWRGSRREVRRALDEGCNLVHSHFALYTFPWLRDLPKNVPLVVLFHGPYAAELAAEATGTKGRLKAVAARAMERSVYRRAARVITLSKAFHDVATGYGVAEDRLRIIPGGVNTSPYLAASTTNLARAQMRWPLDRPILLTVRRLARRMGLEGLIDAMNIVRRAHPNVLLFIGGKGALAGALQARIDANGLSENVKLLGFIADDQLASAYAAADLMIVPTVALEGFGLVTVFLFHQLEL